MAQPKRVIHFEVQADDIERAKKFYEKVFDWKIEMYDQKDEKVGMDYWMIITGPDGTPGINGGMYIRPKKDALHNYDCTISVEDIDEAIEAVKKNGGKITIEKMQMKDIGWFARATDTEGNTFGLMQPTGWSPH